MLGDVPCPKIGAGKSQNFNDSEKSVRPEGGKNRSEKLAQPFKTANDLMSRRK